MALRSEDKSDIKLKNHRYVKMQALVGLLFFMKNSDRNIVMWGSRRKLALGITRFFEQGSTAVPVRKNMRGDESLIEEGIVCFTEAISIYEALERPEEQAAVQRNLERAEADLAALRAARRDKRSQYYASSESISLRARASICAPCQADSVKE